MGEQFARLQLQRRQRHGDGATWIVGPAGAVVMAFTEVVSGLVDHASSLGQIAIADMFFTQCIVAPAAQIHLVGLLYVSINMHYIDRGGAVTESDRAWQSVIDLPQEIAGA